MCLHSNNLQCRKIQHYDDREFCPKHWLFVGFVNVFFSPHEDSYCAYNNKYAHLLESTFVRKTCFVGQFFRWIHHQTEVDHQDHLPSTAELNWTEFVGFKHPKNTSSRYTRSSSYFSDEWVFLVETVAQVILVSYLYLKQFTNYSNEIMFFSSNFCNGNIFQNVLKVLLPTHLFKSNQLHDIYLLSSSQEKLIYGIFYRNKITKCNVIDCDTDRFLVSQNCINTRK